MMTCCGIWSRRCRRGCRTSRRRWPSGCPGGEEWEARGVGLDWGGRLGMGIIIGVDGGKRKGGRGKTGRR